MGCVDRFSLKIKRSVKAAILLAACAGLGVMCYPVGAAEKNADTGDKKADFAKDIQPILKESCIKCHKAPEARGPGGGPGGGGPGGPGGGPGGGRPRGPAGGLRLDDKDAALKGGKHGNAIVPGKAEESLVYKLLSGPTKEGDDEIHAMPRPKPREEFKPLPDEKIQLIKKWIDEGAQWPEKQTGK